MKKISFFIFNLFLTLNTFAQQTQQYTQFLFNRAGYNPAANGYSFKSPYEIIFGGRYQWIGFGNSPSEIFLNANYTLIPPPCLSQLA